MRVALVHYWLLGMRGGEKVLEALGRMFPQADVFTHVCRPGSLSPELLRHRITTTAISRLPFATRFYQSYLPLMPGALEALDLSSYDLVISSEAGPAKGVIAPPNALHLCYCHSPMRYLWDQYHVYRAGAGPLTRMAMPVLAQGLRQWDVTSAARVDQFVANSRHVAARIGKYWRRDAVIVHPPVAVDEFARDPAAQVGDYYLWAGELVTYKRPDIVIEAFNRLGYPLVVIGGPEKARARLQRKAGSNIKFLGKTSFETLKACMAECRALVFPGEEDFGMVPVEAMASGRPVIAYGCGGALETIIHGETGYLFGDQSVDGLIGAIREFEAMGLDRVDPARLTAHARRFDEARFVRRMGEVFAQYGVRVPAAAGREASGAAPSQGG